MSADDIPTCTGCASPLCPDCNPAAACTATRHDTALAYMVDRCRCDPAREGYRIYRKRLREGRHQPSYIPTTGVQRRLRALTALGWSPRELGARTGYSVPTIQALRGAYRPNIRRDTAARIALLYDELSATPGPSDRVRAVARRAGWAPPLLWEGVDIDHPDAHPVDDHARPGSGNPRIDLDEVDYLASWGVPLEQAAARLGVDPESIGQARRRRRARAATQPAPRAATTAA